MNSITRPATKPMLVPYINKSRDAVHLGGFQQNLARELFVDDPEELYKFLVAMDGTKTVKELSEKFALSLDDTMSLLNDLQSNGVIYENVPLEEDFSQEELEYYSRNLNYFAWIDIHGKYYNYWNTQLNLKKASVLILGAGGAGGNAAMSLAMIGIGNLTIVDFDRVEMSNLNRQPYDVSDVGDYKVLALKKHINAKNPFIHVDVSQSKIQSLVDIESFGNQFDLVISAIDSPNNISDELDAYTQKYEIPWILGGYASTVVNHAIFDGTTPGFSKLIKKQNETDFNGKQVSLGTKSQWRWKNAIVAPVAITSGAFSAVFALYYLTGLKELKPGLVQHIDFYNVQDQENFTYMIEG
ncbi:HesA/MoeB/ThiF family protein [Lactiplantibacillus plantarum]|uniref:HesA/MoeB/ThiF family protein n=1 Tax=Lactiplantibacillus plantarum TaxID=1590 RepID=UPI000B567109|nr:ThiF family adenylyltransferase [Lactiplantibacillus plantarum]ARW14478.1 Adenylyltransferase and sulfurtransferase MOCS3 [Lactiplantibacillus plantarum subsp. plantarum]MDO7794597.1 ThiF family adenylyltransferase [Lactiplantibacillus plantarum]QHM22458.1 putative adenylyltransferase/sulfurtransferase MoeZ [Lactiplantibacillus plantarum]QHM24603.1 putative adenylyltransferase/sulfurtransferase MoeZ [Lactiplantibacillus plantarum]QHM28372.1 putative adenylyltransferase/sulfurtransferase Moe